MREGILAREVMQRLEEAIPNADVALHHKSPFQLLIATILSAQCTDVRVNQVTPALFKRYSTPEDFASADQDILEAMIRPTGFYKNKAKNIINCAKEIVLRFGGRVPGRMDALVTLPGVGRKTANVVMGNVFGVPSIVVDTHVRRVVRRLKWTQSSDPDQIEVDLSHLLPQEKWTSGSHRLLLHGRHLCVARDPRCLKCPIFDFCPAEAEKNRAHLKDASVGRSPIFLQRFI